jgi:hypothetical protein
MTHYVSLDPSCISNDICQCVRGMQNYKTLQIPVSPSATPSNEMKTHSSQCGDVVGCEENDITICNNNIKGSGYNAVEHETNDDIRTISNSPPNNNDSVRHYNMIFDDVGKIN